MDRSSLTQAPWSWGSLYRSLPIQARDAGKITFDLKKMERTLCYYVERRRAEETGREVENDRYNRTSEGKMPRLLSRPRVLGERIHDGSFEGLSRDILGEGVLVRPLFLLVFSCFCFYCNLSRCSRELEIQDRNE